LATITNVAHGYVARDDKNKEIVVAMRGTQSQADFDIDSDAVKVPWTMPGSEGCGPDCKLHEGFHDTAAAAAPIILKAVQEAKAKNPDYKILVTGHSLGGEIFVLQEEFPTRKN
jgi:hypothetical protein